MLYLYVQLKKKFRLYSLPAVRTYKNIQRTNK